MRARSDLRRFEIYPRKILVPSRPLPLERDGDYIGVERHGDNERGRSPRATCRRDRSEEMFTVIIPWILHMLGVSRE